MSRGTAPSVILLHFSRTSRWHSMWLFYEQNHELSTTFCRTENYWDKLVAVRVWNELTDEQIFYWSKIFGFRLGQQWEVTTKKNKNCAMVKKRTILLWAKRRRGNSSFLLWFWWGPRKRDRVINYRVHNFLHELDWELWPFFWLSNALVFASRWKVFRNMDER